VPRFTFPRRQQFRRLRRAAACAAATIALAGGTIIAAANGQLVLAILLVVAAFGCGVRSWSWVRLAGRSRVGARSEDEVQRALADLEREGWRMRHSLRWAGRGDIDHLAIAPTGMGFVIETKTLRFHPEHLERTLEMARWLQAGRRSWVPNGARPVLCVVRARQVQQTQAGVLVVSLDQLVVALRIAAGTRSRPLFLSRTPGGTSTDDRLGRSVPA
jgi:Nuclease-related domain